MDILNRILVKVTFLHHPGAKRGRPCAIVVPALCGKVTVNKKVVKEIHPERLIHLIAHADGLELLTDVLF